jgi:outer membrane protein assembly factor BamB
MASSPAIAGDGTILVGSRNRRLYAVSSNGKTKWSFKTGGWVDSSVAISTEGTIHFGSWDGKFYALTPDGERKWEFVTGAPVVSSAAIDLNGTIYFGSHDGRLYALNPDGSKRWDFATRGPIISSPAIANNGDILFSSLDGRLYALDADGKPRWVLHTGGITAASPVVATDGTIYLGINSNHCAITVEGKIKWQAAMSPTGYVPPDWIVSTPARDWIWNYDLKGPSRSSVCVGPGGTIYAMSTAGFLFAFENATPLAASSWPMFRADPQHTGRARPSL